MSQHGKVASFFCLSYGINILSCGKMYRVHLFADATNKLLLAHGRRIDSLNGVPSALTDLKPLTAMQITHTETTFNEHTVSFLSATSGLSSSIIREILHEYTFAGVFTGETEGIPR